MNTAGRYARKAREKPSYSRLQEPERNGVDGWVVGKALKIPHGSAKNQQFLSVGNHTKRGPTRDSIRNRLSRPRRFVRAEVPFRATILKTFLGLKLLVPTSLFHYFGLSSTLLPKIYPSLPLSQLLCRPGRLCTVISVTHFYSVGLVWPGFHAFSRHL